MKACDDVVKGHPVCLAPRSYAHWCDRHWAQRKQVLKRRRLRKENRR